MRAALPGCLAWPEIAQDVGSRVAGPSGGRVDPEGAEIGEPDGQQRRRLVDDALGVPVVLDENLGALFDAGGELERSGEDVVRKLGIVVSHKPSDAKQTRH